jgi:hypothetical protein
MALRLSLEWNDLSQEVSISFESAIKWAQLVNKLQSLDRCLSDVTIDVRSDDEVVTPEVASISSAFFDLKAKIDKRSWVSSSLTVF